MCSRRRNSCCGPCGVPCCYPQARAFITSCSDGSGCRRPISCRLGPAGTNPQCLMQPQCPVTLRINAPCPIVNCCGHREPYRFCIDPLQVYGRGCC